MPQNPASQDVSAYRAIAFGFMVARAAAALPQTAQAALFNVVGGRIALLGILGTVGTVIQTQANNTKLVANPTTGTDVDLCAVLSITAKEPGTLFGITGIFSDALVGANAGATVFPQRPIIIPVGSIDLNCAASNTGTIGWELWYLPLDDGAYVAAA